MAREDVTRWAQRSVAAGAGFLVLWAVATLAGAPRRATVALALQGFVLHVVFGKAYSLVPSYFDRQLSAGRLPAVQVPLTVAGALALAGGGWVDPLTAGGRGGPQAVESLPPLESIGAVLWSLGAAAFLGAVLWSVRDNITGAETATSEANADRRPVDRAANAFVPVVLAYLGAGAYVSAATAVGLPSPVSGYAPRISHLLAAGAAALLLFAVGFRLLPRFMVTEPPRGLHWVVLPAGAVGPVLLAVGLPAGPLLQAGAVVETVAVAGFATTVLAMYRRTDRDRVGFHGVAAGALAALVGVALGLQFAFAGTDPALVRAHLRVNLVGFLGLSVVGVSFQFYPPNVGSMPGADDRTALAAMALLASGLAVQVAGFAGQAAGRMAVGELLVTGGEVAALAGAGGYAYLLLGLLVERGEV